MTLGDAIGTELPFLQQQAESLMLDTGQALRPTGGYEYVDGEDVEATTPLFSSPCKIQTRTLVSRTEEVGGRTATVVRVELHLPADTDALTTGDLWEMTAVADGSTAVVGRRYRILAPHEKTHPTARRYDVEVVL